MTAGESLATNTAAARRRRALATFGLLFGALYFIQGFGEPTEGLVAQPMRSLLRDRGSDTAETATVMAVLSVPWMIKPLFGLLIDFLPLPLGRRKPYLLLATLATTLALGAIGFKFAEISGGQMLTALFVATMGVACADVVCDALMVERGQQLGITGSLQSIQWAAAYGATIVTGALGGHYSEHKQQSTAFLVCGLAAAVSFVLTAVFVRERPLHSLQNPGETRPTPRETARAILSALRDRTMLGVLTFLFLWNFNPFNTVVLHAYATKSLELSEQFYGWTISILAVASIVASVAYGVYCRRAPFRLLLHLAIALGVLATLAYLALIGPLSALLVTVAVGLTYTTATLIQLDLAARICPPAAAGTVFASLMAVTNVATLASQALGGRLYEQWSQSFNEHVAFRWLVLCGAASTAVCWLVVPLLEMRFIEPISSDQHPSDQHPSDQHPSDQHPSESKLGENA